MFLSSDTRRLVSARAYQEPKTWGYSNDKSSISHTSYLQQAFAIRTANDRREFYQSLAADYQAKRCNFYNERRKIDPPTALCPLYMDLDMFFRAPVTYETPLIKYIIDVVQDVTKQLWPAVPSHQCIVTSSTSKLLAAHSARLRATGDRLTLEKNVYKTGFHLTWPDIIVNTPRLYEHRQRVVDALVRALPDVFYEPASGIVLADWDADVVDKTVIANGSLRMLGQCKAVVCKLCKNQKDRVSNCAACERAGYLHEHRPYQIVALVDGPSDELTHLQEDFYYALDRLAIRLDPAWSNVIYISPWVGPDTADAEKALIDASLQNKSRSAPKKDVIKRSFPTTTDIDLGEKKVTFVLLDDPVIHEHVQRFIRNNFNGPPSIPEEIITKLLIKADGDGSIWYVVGKSKYCRNKGACHGSADIFYERRCNLMVQRCYSQKSTCPDYKSPPVVLPDVLVQMVTNYYLTKIGQPKHSSSKSYAPSKPRDKEHARELQEIPLPTNNLPPILATFLSEYTAGMSKMKKAKKLNDF